MVYSYDVQAFALAMVVHYTAPRGYMMAVSEADCGLHAGCIH